MRIAMVSEHASPLAVLGEDAGGQNVHVAALSAALARRGHDVTVYTRRNSPRLAARVVMQPGVEVVHVDAGPAEAVPKDELLPFMPLLAEGMVADWQQAEPDIIHAHFWMSGVAALDAVERLAEAYSGRRPPVVQTFHALGTVKRRHQGAQDTSPPEREQLEPWVGRTADRIIATCSDEVRELKAMGIEADTVSVAPCGVDLNLFSATGPAEPRSRGYRVVVVGRLVPRKGVDLVIRALARLKEDRLDDVELLVVGAGTGGTGLAADPEARRLLDLAVKLDVADQVVLRGQVPREQMPTVLRSADAVVCAPWYEPFGIVPLEAMACGVPVVATAVGGLTDTVVDRVTGLHVPPRDPDALASALGDLLRNPYLAEHLGREGHRRVHARYSWDRIAEDTEKAYRLTLDGSDHLGPVRAALKTPLAWVAGLNNAGGPA